MCEGLKPKFLFFPFKETRLIEASRWVTSSALILSVSGTAQRQIGETAMNETSSRSHQILRLVGPCAVLNDVQMF